MIYNKRNYFIDWIALYIPFTPRSELERNDNWVDFDHEFYKTYVTNRIDKMLHDYSPHFKLLSTNNIKPYNIMKSRKSMRLEFRGSFFKGNSLKDDITDFYEVYQKIKLILLLNGKVKLGNASIFRLDISTNVNQKLMTKRNKRRFKLKTNRRCYESPYCRNLNDPNQITGYQFGISGRQSMPLKVYEKYYDKNKTHDLIRFGTDDFVRIEYSVGSNILKRMNLKTPDLLYDLTRDQEIRDFYLSNSHSNLNKIKKQANEYHTEQTPVSSKAKMYNIIDYIHKCKRVVFPHEPEHKPSAKLKPYIPKPYNALPTIESLIFNYTDKDQRKRLMENILNYEN
jgi:hypothetical protein